jgi:transglutaminase-like putative cysteine protease
MEIPEGKAGVQATLKMMSDLVKAGKKNPAIRQRATNLTQDLPQKDRIGEIRKLFDYVQNSIRYVRDIHDVETLHYAEQVMSQEYGDCDDKAVLMASLLEAIGFTTRFVAVGFQPGVYSHVFVDVRIGNGRGAVHPSLNFGQWLTLDTTEPQPMGWRPPGIVEILPWYN